MQNSPENAKAFDLNFQNEALKKFAATNRAKEEASVQVPVEVQKAEPESTEEPIKQVAEEAPKEQPKKEEPTKATKEEKVADVELSWDTEEAEPKKESKVDFDFSELGGALELGEVKTKEEFIAKASELKSKLKQFEEAPLSGIPDEFKEVIKVAKAGDWRSYLAEESVDWSKLDPAGLFEDEWIKTNSRNPRFYTDGKLNQDMLEEALAGIPEASKYYEGTRIQQGLIEQQQRRKAQIAVEAEQKLARAEKVLSTATKNLQEILPFESYGIKFGPKHSSEIYQGISNSKLTRKHLGVDYESLVRSGADMTAISATIAKAEYAEKMLKFKADNSRVQGKKEILELTQNAQIKSPGSAAKPESEQKQKSPMEIYREKLLSQQQKGGL